MADFNLQGMIDWAIEWCNKPNVGYWMSAYYRNMATANGITYFDCSSFVFFAVWLGGGYDIGQLGYPTDLEGYKTKHGQDGYNAWTVTPMMRGLQRIGFQKITPVPSVWKPGDVLAWVKPEENRGHTEICYASPRITMGAHNSHYALEDQVSINTWNSDQSTYQALFRYKTQPPPEPPEPPLPPEPEPGGDPGSVDDARKTKIWFYMKPWWKI